MQTKERTMQHTARGFTMIELMATLALAAVLMAQALPSFAALRERAQVRATVQELVTTFNRARTEAVMRHHQATVCPLPEDRALRCAADTTWEHGWMIYFDYDRNDERGEVEPVISVFDAIDSLNLQLRSTTGRLRVRFLPNGLASGSNATLRLCVPDRPELGRAVVVNNAGRVRSESHPQQCAESA
jgi:type IV fimbrial biogenesis protein FimT